jgi:hypothetical protein
MALQYCSQHNRLFVRQRQDWIAFPADLITQITALYQRIPRPEFEVIEEPCDRCEASGGPREISDTPQ